MLELAFAVVALARPNVCVFPPGQPPECGGPPPVSSSGGGSTGTPTGPAPPPCVQPPVPTAPGPPTIGPGPPCGGSTGGAIANGPATYTPTLILPKRVRVGEHVRIWAAEQISGSLCYAIGRSKIGCASSNVGAFYIVVRPGRVQYVMFREDGHVVDRRIYRDGVLVPHTS